MTGLARPKLHPIVVEERKTSSRSSQSTSPKGVHFPDGPSPVSSFSRRLTSIEAWSLYHFEKHALACPDCYEPYEKHKASQLLCPTGQALAQDVAMHVYQRHDQIYSTTRDGDSRVRVEIDPGYTHLRGLLKVMSREARRSAKSPIMTNAPSRSTKKPKRDSRYEEPTRAEVVVERPRPHGTKSRHKARYSPVIVDVLDDFAKLRVDVQYPVVTSTSRGEHRTEYRTEVREPERTGRRKKGYHH